MTVDERQERHSKRRMLEELGHEPLYGDGTLSANAMNASAWEE